MSYKYKILSGVGAPRRGARPRAGGHHGGGRVHGASEEPALQEARPLRLPRQETHAQGEILMRRPQEFQRFFYVTVATARAGSIRVVSHL